MSMEAIHFTIIGYDLTSFKTDNFDDWKWTKEGEKYLCYQSKGNIQLFDDPEGGNHLYFGYIFSKNDGYGDDISYFMADIHRQIPDVKGKLKELVRTGVISNEVDYEKIQFISFVEWR